MFTWMPGNAYAMQATLYENNITLNNPAAAKLKDFRWCMVGFDERNKKMAIKGISKEDADHKLVPLENLNKISLGKGYARISNKSIVEYAGKVAGTSCVNRKFPIQYDDREQMLIVDLNTEKEVSI